VQAVKPCALITTGAAGRPKVIYVMGAGRSGSTIFGITLGNCEGLFYAGELDAWFARGGTPLLDDPDHRRFWAQVRSGVPGAEPLFGYEVQRAIERSLSVFRINKWPVRRRLRRSYKAVSQAVYEAVAETARKRVIVDTSHYPLRARELQSLDGIDLFLVYLMRDPQSVVASFNNKDVAQYNKSTVTTNVYLWLTSMLAAATFMRHPRERRMFVSYEDFIADPARILSDLLGAVGEGALPTDFTQLRTGVPFQGNRVIRSDVVALAPASPQRPPRSALTAAAQLPWVALARRLRPRAGSGEAAAVSRAQATATPEASTRAARQ
jgi:hypothetical protein